MQQDLILSTIHSLPTVMMTTFHHALSVVMTNKNVGLELGKQHQQAVLAALAGMGSAVAIYWALKRVPVITVPLEPMEAMDFPPLDAHATPHKVDGTFSLKVADRPGKVQCHDKATAEVIGEVDDMTADDVKVVLQRARKAQLSWAKTSFAKRRKFLQLLLKYTVERADVICRASMRDSGKVKLDAVLGELVPTLEKLRWVINNGERVLASQARGGQGLMTMHKSARLEYRPVGVIAVFAPFNYPYTNMMNHIISGVFAGNAVVCKVSEFTSWSAALYTRIVRTALAEVGGDPDLVQVVTGLAPAGAALSTSPLVDKIIFTGSDRIGKIIMKQAADNLTPCVLELGGKDPFIVFADVNVDRVSRIAARGTFQNAGQNCIGIERIFVERTIEKEFIAKLTAIAKSMHVGLPMNNNNNNTDKAVDLGPLCTLVQLKHVEALVNDAISKGAKLHCGGKRVTQLEPGLFFEPTVLSGITREMRITQEEVFGPVACIRAFDNEDDLVNMVNDCPFALGSSVFSNNTRRATRVAGKCHAGMCNLNDFGVNYLVQSLPFGGVKASGYGRFGGEEGLRACCHEFSITQDASSLIETDLPKPFTYPVAKNSPTTALGLIRLAYGDGMMDSASGLLGLLKGLMFPTY